MAMDIQKTSTVAGLGKRISQEKYKKHVSTNFDLGGEELSVYNESLFDDWADTYDEYMDGAGAQGFTIASKVLERYIGDNKNARIIDVAAGTGRCGEVLFQLGFSNIDALDISENMLEKAKERNVYKHFIQAAMNSDHTSGILDDSYDALICTHSFSVNQLPSEALDEFPRIVTSGGWLCFTAKKDFVIRKKCGFLQKICDLVLSRKIDMIYSEEFQYHKIETKIENCDIGNQNIGNIFVCKVL